MNDMDTTLVVLVGADDDLTDYQHTALDIMPICPTEEGGNAEVTASGRKGLLFANATMKGIGHYGVDVHWGIQRTYDFYKTKFNYNSYDNTGSPIISFINPIESGPGNELLNITEPNAFANQRAQPFLAFGRGSNVRGYEEQVDISVTAHEFTHLVTFKTAELEYMGEPGALNEAFSDIFGVAVKKYVVDHYLTDKKGDIEYIYSIGADSERTSDLGMTRSCFDPWRCVTPKAFMGKYWTNPQDKESDNGGVHTNSNVLNFWFYLLAEGYDPNGEYSLDTSVVDEQWAKTISWEGIGIEKAERIAFRMLTRYMFTTANYYDAYNQSFVAAQDLGYDENSTEYKTIQLCWKAVAPINYLQGSLTEAFSLELTSIATTRIGYKETYTQEASLRNGGPLTMILSSPQLSLYVKQEKELLEDARTFKVDEEQGKEGDLIINIIACSGYPIKVQPQNSGETVYYKLYRINEDKSETELDTKTEFLTEKEILENQSMIDTKNKKYEVLFNYGNAELSKPGTYKLKVSFTWAALKDAEFIIEVEGSDTAISERTDDSTADSTFDSAKTYDLQGRVVSTLRKGVYIRNGKKVIGR